MVHYRLYFFDAHGHIGRAVDLECSDDEEAIERVRQHAHANALELWQGARRVIRLERGST